MPAAGLAARFPPGESRIGATGIATGDQTVRRSGMGVPHLVGMLPATGGGAATASSSRGDPDMHR